MNLKGKKQFELVRLVGEERRVGSTLAAVSRHWQGKRERFLFISPHDDDVAIGGGLMLQLAKKEKIPVHIVIVTNGALGYCTREEKDFIADIRRRETDACYRKLGVPRGHIYWLGYPDCSLALYQGRRRPRTDWEPTLENYTGLQNSFTYFLRRIRPTQVFVPTRQDLHPDHKYTYQELLISTFHAAGSIWPELGRPIDTFPFLHEMAVYCDFPESPKVQLTSAVPVFERKLAAISAFKSQRQIKMLVGSIRQGGPVEYFQPVDFRLYDPRKYYHTFADTTQFKTIEYH